MRALLCGMRGSTPAPGAEFSTVGGNTSCVAVPAHDGRWLLLDAGTGMARLASVLDDEPLRASVLLTHLHWDHTHGPAVPRQRRQRPRRDRCAASRPGQRRDSVGDDGPSDVPATFPVGPDELHGTWRYRTLQPGRWEIEGFEVTAGEIQHAGGRTFGYRVVDDTGSLAYLPDHSPRLATAERRATAAALIEGVDVLLHGGGYVDAERDVADGYGHATTGDAIDLATAGGVGRLVLIHHAPRRTDEEIAAIAGDLATIRHPFDIEIGCEGTWLDVGRRR